MKRISTIGFQIPTNEDNYIQINSLSSLSDTDIAIFSPDLDFEDYGYKRSEDYEGQPLYTKESSARILDHAKHWKTEITNFLQHGGTLFITLEQKKDFYIYTGEKSISGTGRGQTTTNHVMPYNNYEFLPQLGVTYHAASGKTVVPNDPLVAEFYKNFRNYLSFETYLKSEKDLDVIFTTKKKDRMLGTAYIWKNAQVIFIPKLDFLHDDFIKYIGNTEDYDWTATAKKYGKIFLANIAEIDKAIRKGSEVSPRPNWLKNSVFNLKASEITLEKIKKNKQEILKKTAENEKLTETHLQQEGLKDLLFETGKRLELSVINALGILGYKAENYDDGELELDQIITSPEGHRFIGECEGKDNKDIDVSKFRQLLDGLNADFEKETVTERAHGILFGNAQRLTDPGERSLSFTDKCQSGAKREGIALIKTEDLFNICRYISENNDEQFAAICRERIVEQLGSIVHFPDLPVKTK